MPQPVFVPRINNNDDEVRLIAVLVSPGEAVTSGQAVAEIESEKATVVVEAEADGFVLEASGAEGEMLDVGAVLMWIGATPDEAVPEEQPAKQDAAALSASDRPTAGALALMKEHGMSAGDIPVSGARMKVSDVEAFIAANAPNAEPAKAAVAQTGAPDADGKSVEFSAYEAAMLNSVSWHANDAAATYLEADYDEADWQAFAQNFRDTHGLLSSPLVPLMAYQLVRHAADNPDLNTTVHNGRKYVYDCVNLGFTVHIGGKLFLPVVHEADGMDGREFVDAFARLHRSAMRGKLQPAEMSGATVAISSMARWPVLRHMPILPPFVSLMVAHSAARDGRSILGATYDHRVLDGAAAFQALNHLTSPNENAIAKE
ncbi:2-oxo acid dehydrogenase subunit E2 [Nitratireductor sp. XY-223]|uniref:2-oxo acid dehydrogenase subunit E2 n=1 Tax=Nitratireductor sp. XY-223 TaxID=2561926 RepID=UPI0010AA6CC4|nr:2-oxo acid dehydrogenase subunit E2 [Nitratireductor sp. XY-223]